jgi:hypothetical protein
MQYPLYPILCSQPLARQLPPAPSSLTMKFALSLCLLASATAFAPSVRTAASLRSAGVSTSLSMAGVLNRVTGQSQLDPAVIQRYMDLPMPADTVLAEYVWVDADGACRSKTRTLPAAKVCAVSMIGIDLLICAFSLQRNDRHGITGL